MKRLIAVLDYGMGNLRSVEKALEKLGSRAELTSDPELLDKARGIILPGVGAFGEAMRNLEEYGLAEPLKEKVKSGVPCLGICLGLQLLFDSSEESPGVNGLGLLPGRVVRFETTLKVPHMGWNELQVRNRGGLFKDVADGTMVYFVHSYYGLPSREEDTAMVCDYAVEFAAAVERDNLAATQFHPEKSGEKGLAILAAFAERCR